MTLLVLLGMFLSFWPWSVPVAKAETVLPVCDSENPSRFTANDSILTHTCVKNGTKDYQTITFRKIAAVSGDKLTQFETDPFDNASKTYNIYKLEGLSVTEDIFLPLDISQIPAKIYLGIWNKSENSEFLYEWGMVQPAEGPQEQQIREYLRYLNSPPRSGWGVNYTGGARQSCEHGVNYYTDNNFFNVDIPTTAINFSTTPPTMRIPVKGGENAVFTYKGYMHWGGRVRRDNWYYYFLAPQNSNYCNLAIRFSDSSGTADVIAINLGNIGSVDGQNESLFELNTSFKSFTISNTTFVDFIKKLYKGKTPGQISTRDKEKQTGPDNLNGTNLASGDNPAASTPPDANKRCEKFGETTVLFGLIKIPTIAKALCEAAYASAGVAASISSYSFNWLLTAAGLQ